MVECASPSELLEDPKSQLSALVSEMGPDAELNLRQIAAAAQHTHRPTHTQSDLQMRKVTPQEQL